MDAGRRHEDADQNSGGRRMIVRSIEASNFMQYAEINLKDIPRKGVIGIFGKNEYGKSTIADTICFALFGEVPRSKVQAFKKTDFVMWGTSSCQVSLVFEVEGKLFEVWRKLTASGVSDAWLKVFDTGEVLAVKNKAVDEYIESKILGFGFNEFRYSSYVAQKEIEIINENASDVKGVINNMLGITLLADAGTESLREKKRLKEDILPGAQNTLDVLNDRLGKWSGKRTEAIALKEEVKSNAKSITEYEESIKNKKNEHKKMEKVRKIEAEREKLTTVMKEKKKHLARLKKQVDDATKDAEKYELLKGQLQNQEIKRDLERSDIVNSSIELVTESKKLTDKCSSIQNEIDLHQKQLSGLKAKQVELASMIDMQEKSDKVTVKFNALKKIAEFKNEVTKIHERLVKSVKIDEMAIETKKKHLNEKRCVLQGVNQNEETELNQRVVKAEDKVKSSKEGLKLAKTGYKSPVITAAILIIVGAILAVFSIILGLAIIGIGALVGSILFMKAHRFVANANKVYESAKEDYDTWREEIGRLKALKNSREQLISDTKELYLTVQQLEKTLENNKRTIGIASDIGDNDLKECMRLCMGSEHTDLIDTVKMLSDIPSETLPNEPVNVLLQLLPNIEKSMIERQEREALIKQFKEEVRQIEQVETNLGKRQKEMTDKMVKLRTLEASKRKNLEQLQMPDEEHVLDKLNSLRKRIETLKETMKKTEGGFEELEKSVAKLPELIEDQRVTHEEITKLEGAIAELPDEVEFDEDEFNKLRKLIEKLEKECLKLKEETAHKEGKIKELVGDTKEFKKLTSQIDDKMTEIAALEATMENYTDLRAEFTGLQEIIRGGISPQLQQYFSWVLPRITEDRYKMVEISGDFKMQVFSEDKGDYVDLSQLSGGTKDQLLLSLRLGFSRALNSAKSNDKQFIFLDEPFSSFDKGRREAFIDFLRNFEKTFQQIFLISHIDGLENMVDQFIQIEKDGEGYSYPVASWDS